VYFTGSILAIINAWLSRAIAMDPEEILVIVDKGDKVRAGRVV